MRLSPLEVLAGTVVRCHQSGLYSLWLLPLSPSTCDSIHNIMADDRSHETQRGLSAHSIAYVRQFNRAQNLGLAKEDAIGNLLNDAVTVHVDRESHKSPDDTE
jgi:hypothetical protein